MCTYRLTKEWVIIGCNQDWSQSCLLRNGCSKSRSKGHKGLPMNPYESRGASTSTFMTLQYRHIQSAYWVHTTCIDIKATTTRFMFTPPPQKKKTLSRTANDQFNQFTSPFSEKHRQPKSLHLQTIENLCESILQTFSTAIWEVLPLHRQAPQMGQLTNLPQSLCHWWTPMLLVKRIAVTNKAYTLEV